MAGLVNAARLPAVADVVGDTDRARPWLDDAALRQRAADALPAVVTRESWKYTPLGPFLESLAGAEAGRGQVEISGTDQAGVTATAFDDLSADQQSRLRQHLEGAMAPDRHAVADLALLRARNGWLVEIAAEIERPLDIHYPDAGMVPVVVLLHAHASVTLVEHLQTRAFLAQVTHIDIADGARLQHHRAALEADVGHYSLLNVRLAKHASYRLTQSATGGRRRRLETHVTLDGGGAEAELSGAYLVEDGQHLDQQLVIEHRHGHTRSHQKFHGIGAGKGRSVFNGRIHIHRHAPASDAQLSNRNLALHPEAEMNTKPELEIYTDDVRCAHGATVGRLSDDALFYLTARGIPEPEARRLLAYGFVGECLDGPLAETAVTRFRDALS